MNTTTTYTVTAEHPKMGVVEFTIKATTNSDGSCYLNQIVEDDGEYRLGCSRDYRLSHEPAIRRFLAEHAFSAVDIEIG